MIGLAAVLLLALVGRIAGISGILNGAIEQHDGRAWRWSFLLGLMAGAALWFALGNAVPPPRTGFPLPWLLTAGLLVGFGTRLGSGCTSGHGICGLARLSKRSLAAVVAFMGAGIANGVRVAAWLGTAAMTRLLYALLAGAVFGLGLAVSGMTDPDKVLNFLDVAGRWDPSLALVMAAALGVATPGYAWVRRRSTAICGDPLQLPGNTRIDARLVAGSVLFGIGWGIAGYCPGPALANLARGTMDVLVFVAALLAGSLLARTLDRRP